ncbi:DUF4148 domain-containing protein [Paraburkholderia sprentiae WSM5005]|uniref:DUF4148 domain-containing protein n=1 Tax=Paraburkholderia sprentiae WSM5005 TaxID=754502 RepID=A0A1I9YQU1_9BURK|nr:DUF4148 domain-containing protein [Paraburkholderia sprentiae]APA89313.2 DUF4148 domain-containing protein [Paraburkholderia sprentiae WSM5005]
MKMRLTTKTFVTALLLIGSASAMASPGLTQQQCEDYPFEQLKGEVTHQQLMRELNELEAAGYNPDDANAYPDDLEQAQQKLQAEYRADCVPTAAHLSPSAPQTSAGVAPAQAAHQPAG